MGRLRLATPWPAPAQGPHRASQTQRRPLLPPHQTSSLHAEQLSRWNSSSSPGRPLRAGGHGRRAVDPCARPRGAACATSGDLRHDRRHLPRQQARALGRVHQRGQALCNKVAPVDSGPWSTPPADASAGRIVRPEPLQAASHRHRQRQRAADRTGHHQPFPSTPSDKALYPGELVPIPLCSPALTGCVHSR